MAGLDHFGWIAPLYDRLIPLRKPDHLISILKLPVSGPLLDAGGGTGRVAQALRGLASPVIVADPSAEMLQQAGQKDGLRPVRSLAEQLPYPEGLFERIIMIDTLHHVYNQTATAGELWRVLKPGGRIVIEEPDVRTFIVKLVALFEKMALMRSHFLTPEQISDLFPFPEARTKIIKDGFNAWIMVDKRRTP